jgi:hypothetical protein
VFVRRDFFNEEPFLRKMLEVHGAAVEMKRRDFLEGHWGPYLLRACSLKVNYKYVLRIPSCSTVNWQIKLALAALKLAEGWA